MSENKLLINKHYLIGGAIPEFTFAGIVLETDEGHNPAPDVITYYWGDLGGKTLCVGAVVIADISSNYADCATCHLGQVPMLIEGIGILFPQVFDNYFDALCAQHTFQKLTESNKGGCSMRVGAYITKCAPTIEAQGGVDFRLMRCSTNLGGPTLRTGEIDDSIIGRVNNLVAPFVADPVELNHVLAQVYKTRTSKISAHSDKTKDMPRNAIMAFCTFYDSLDHPDIIRNGRWDYVYNYSGRSGAKQKHYPLTTVLTHLRFKKKFTSPVERIDIPLYPGSVLLITLETNRFYMHETVPANAPTVPVRMGYVIRCSNTLARWIDGQIYIVTSDGKYTPLRRPSEADYAELREKYFLENTTTDFIDYTDTLYSMNDGDYQCPCACAF